MKEKLKENLLTILAILLIALGVAGIVYAFIMQLVIQVQLFGAVFKTAFVPHLSAFGFLGVIPVFCGIYLLVRRNNGIGKIIRVL